MEKALKQLNMTIPIDDDNMIEHIKKMWLQLSVFTMKNNKKNQIVFMKKHIVNMDNV